MKLEYENKINWQNLADAVDFYSKFGFKYIEVPWIAPTEILKITYPYEYRFQTPLGDLVASGEQSFLHLQFNQGLAPGKYMTITPCFRDEPETKFNFRQFIKLELYITDNVTTKNLLEFIIPSCQVLLSHLVCSHVELIKMENGSFDLMCQGIELGSYGIREHNGHKWIYATGIAEPRTSQVYEISNKNN